MKYREMRRDDFGEIIELSNTIDGVRFTDSENASWHKAFLNRNPGMCFVAERDESIIGFVYCGSDGRRATVYHLAVGSSARGLGIGKNLVRLVEDAISTAGVSRGQLMVQSTNAAVVEFYSKLGWRMRDDLLLMTKDMPDGSGPQDGAWDAPLD